MYQPLLHLVIRNGDSVTFRDELLRSRSKTIIELDPRFSDYAHLMGRTYTVDLFPLAVIFKSHNPFSSPPGIYANSQSPNLLNRQKKIIIPTRYLQLSERVYKMRVQSLSERLSDRPGILLSPFDENPKFEPEDIVKIKNCNGRFRVHSLNLATLDENDNEYVFSYNLLPIEACLDSNGFSVQRLQKNILERDLTLHSHGQISRYFNGQSINFPNLEEEIIFRFIHGDTERTNHKVIDDLENFLLNNPFTLQSKSNLIYRRIQEGKADFVIGCDGNNSELEVLVSFDDLEKFQRLIFMRCKNPVFGKSVRDYFLETLVPQSNGFEA